MIINQESEKRLVKYSSKYLDILLVFIICMLTFRYILEHVNTDIQMHLKLIIRINTQQANYPPNFLFYFVVNLLSFFSSSSIIIYRVTVILLSAITTWKFIITKEIIRDLTPNFKSKNGVKLIAFGLFFSFSIPDFYNVFVLDQMYLGRIPSTDWHNSTIIFLFPFALFLFWKQLKVIEKTTISARDLLIIHLLVVINVLIKPSFIFVYIPVTSIMILKKFSLRNITKIIINSSPLIFGIALILVQYLLIYHYPYGIFLEEPNKVIIGRPFEVWSHYIPNWYIPISILFSFAFPITGMIAYKEIWKFRPFVYSFCLTIAGLIISSFIIESGTRQYHGNFMWQNIICTYLLMLSTVIYLVLKYFEKGWKSRKVVLLTIVFTLHFLSGILYLVKIIATQSYY